MEFMAMLKAEWTIIGLRAPIFSWIACIFLLILPLSSIIKLYIRSLFEKSKFHSLVLSIQELKNNNPLRPGKGLSESAYDSLNQIFENYPKFQSAWNNFKSKIIRRTNNDGKDEFWSSESSETSFSESVIVDLPFNREFTLSIPGLVTGIGLFFTFLAILVALFDVRIDEATKRFEGIPTLIGGLSGKFVSSVAALASASIYLFFERPIFHKINSARNHLVSAIDAFTPRLVTTQVLSEVHNVLAEQTNAFRLFNTDLSLRLKQSVSDSVGPILERMVNSVEEFNLFMRKAEANRQDSLLSQIDGILKRLEQAISITLKDMGATFTQSLSGSAKEQFEKVVSGLGGAADILQSMNNQSIDTQAALRELIKLAKTSTADQIAAGQSQVEDLTNVLKGLMFQLKETAGSSMTQMSTVFTNVIYNISEKINKINEEMATVLKTASDNASGAAHAVIQKADDWSIRSSANIDKMVEKYQSQIELTAELNDALKFGLAGFKDSLSKYGQVTDDLKSVTNEIGLSVRLMNQASNHIKEGQDGMKTVAGLTTEQIKMMQESFKTQKETWGEIYKSMQQYKNTFLEVEGSTKRILIQISDNFKNYSMIIEENFGNLVKVSDEHFRNAYEKLKMSVQDLDELLQDLNDVLARKK